MERIEIGGRKWQKYKGDEGQDVYVAEFLEKQEDVLGQYADENFYDILVEDDADFYLPAECDMTVATSCDRECINCLDESRIAFKFRKNVFTQEEQDGALKGLWGAAGETNNRGLAAGPAEGSSGTRDWVSFYQREVLDYYIKGQPRSVDGSDILQEIKDRHKNGTEFTRNDVWLRIKVENDFGVYKGFFSILEERLSHMTVEEASVEAKRVLTDYVSGTSYAKGIWSGIAGFYGRYPRIPYGRQTAFTEHNRETYEFCYPFARKLEKEFARLLPQRHAFQKGCADSIDKQFLIGEDTTFTTITVNTTTHDRNARMACHRDAGSLNEGFSNLTVISDGKKGWEGGYLVTPEVRAAINVRPGDLLLIDNMRVIHGNTPILPPEGNEEDLLRMSLVFYFREDMLKLGSWDYEHTRRAFVDDRRKNQDHPHWREYWNGVSSGMWEEQEWYDYLTQKMGEETTMKYHPEAFEEKSSLESFFS